MSENVMYNPVGSIAETARLGNVGPYQFDRNMTRDPDNVITIFTVNTREQYSASGGVKFAGRAPGERYRRVGSKTDPSYVVDNLAVEGQKDQRKILTEDGQWAVMDWLNPDNVYSLDQDFIVPNRADDSTDLLARGLFFIVRRFNPKGNQDDKPTEDEIKRAETRLWKRYDALVKLYHSTMAQAPARVPGLMASGEMIDALNWADIETPYNTTTVRKVTCERCGDKVKPGVKFHKSESLGVICIEPTTEGWKAAVNAGIKTRADVPEGLGWPGRA